MRRASMLILILVVGLAVVGCGKRGVDLNSDATPRPALESDEVVIGRLVGEFGGKLQLVSLQAPKEVASKSIKENYGSYLSSTLLARWQNDPGQAIGRTVSSPWPERIEVLTTRKLSADTYEVKGEIIEVTSAEKANGGIAAKRPIALGVTRIDGRWLINSVTLGEYAETDRVLYKNTQYGFSFALPHSWNGYTIVTTQWEGLPAGGQSPIDTGTMLSIRHPQWAADLPRQDIPILIFTLRQWDDLQKGRFHIGAAPIGPRELNRNTEFVFALPARYNYAFPVGYEEVERIIETNPLQPSETVKGK